jgi:hypothetical protein
VTRSCAWHFAKAVKKLKKSSVLSLHEQETEWHHWHAPAYFHCEGMEGSTLEKLGGFSSLCLFHRQLGCNDESASTAERAEKLLYYFPHDVPVASQLKHVELCEGLIDFSRTFSRGSGGAVETVELSKRRYFFLEPEAGVWLVLVLVKELWGPNIGGFARSTEGPGDTAPAPEPAGALFSTAMPYTGPPLPPPAKAGAYTSHAQQASAARASLLGVWEHVRTVTGGVRRVTDAPAAAAYHARVLYLRGRLRRAGDARERAEANEAWAAVGRGEGGAGVAPPSPEERALACTLAVSASASPVSALRRSLRDAFDFTLFYCDWSVMHPFEGCGGGPRVHPPSRDLDILLRSFVGNMAAKQPALSHCAVLFDGHVVWGRHTPGLRCMYAHLRAAAFHVLVGRAYEADLRGFETSSAGVGGGSGPPARPSLGGGLDSPALGRGAAALSPGGDSSSPRPGVPRASPAAPWRPRGSSGAVGAGPPPAVWGGASPTASALTDALAEALRRELGAEELGVLAGRAAEGGAEAGVLAVPLLAVALTTAAAAGPLGGPLRSPGLTSSSSSFSLTTLRGASASPLGPAAPSSPSRSTVGGGPSPSSSYFKGPKPSRLAPPALPAASAALGCLSAPFAVPQEWPTLTQPAVSEAYLRTLAPLTRALGGEEVGGGEEEGGAWTSTPGVCPPGLLGRAGCLYLPPAFLDPSPSPRPSHRVLILQQSLFTVLLWLDAGALSGEVPGPILPDIDPARLSPILASLGTVTAAYLTALEPGMGEWMDTVAVAARDVGVEDAPTLGWAGGCTGMDVHGVESVSRVPGPKGGQGGLISQARPATSGGVGAGLPPGLAAAMGALVGAVGGVPQQVRQGEPAGNDTPISPAARELADPYAASDPPLQAVHYANELAAQAALYSGGSASTGRRAYADVLEASGGRRKGGKREGAVSRRLRLDAVAASSGGEGRGTPVAAAEEHLLAARKGGAVLARRTGARAVFMIVPPGPASRKLTGDGREVDGHAAGHLEDLLGRAKRVHELLHG